MDNELLRKLLAIDMQPKHFVAVLRILLDAELDEPKGQTAGAIRQARFRQRHGIRRLYPKDSEWQGLRGEVFRRDGYRCVYCGSDGAGLSLQCDHVVPVSKGGTHDLANLATSCKACNTSKRDAFVDNWRRETAR